MRSDAPSPAVDDVGLVDPRVLQAAIEAWESYGRLGSREYELALTQLIAYLAKTAKFNSDHVTFDATKRDVRWGEHYRSHSALRDKRPICQ